MPRLNGKSSQGSKPMTSLSRTLSWMPHCCPQKQQCVFTRRSGSTLVEARAAVVPDKWGPNRPMIARSSAGSVAIRSALPLTRKCGRCLHAGIQVCLPQSSLRQAEEGPSALRADLLIVAAVGHLVREPELALYSGEIAHHHR